MKLKYFRISILLLIIVILFHKPVSAHGPGGDYGCGIIFYAPVYFIERTCRDIKAYFQGHKIKTVNGIKFRQKNLSIHKTSRTTGIISGYMAEDRYFSVGRRKKRKIKFSEGFIRISMTNQILQGTMDSDQLLETNGVMFNIKKGPVSLYPNGTLKSGHLKKCKTLTLGNKKIMMNPGTHIILNSRGHIKAFETTEGKIQIQYNDKSLFAIRAEFQNNGNFCKACFTHPTVFTDSKIRLIFQQEECAKKNSKNKYIEGLFNVVFQKNGSIHCTHSTTAKTQLLIENKFVDFQPQYLDFFPNGNPKCGTIVNDTSIKVKNRSFLFRGLERICFHTNGNVKRGIIKNDAPFYIQGGKVIFTGGKHIEFYKNSAVKFGYPSAPFYTNVGTNKLCFISNGYGMHFFANGQLRKARLQKPSLISIGQKKLLFRDEISFHPNGRVNSGFLQKKSSLYIMGQQIYFSPYSYGNHNKLSFYDNSNVRSGHITTPGKNHNPNKKIEIKVGRRTLCFSPGKTTFYKNGSLKSAELYTDTKIKIPGNHILIYSEIIFHPNGNIRQCHLRIGKNKVKVGQNTFFFKGNRVELYDNETVKAAYLQQEHTIQSGRNIIKLAPRVIKFYRNGNVKFGHIYGDFHTQHFHINNQKEEIDYRSAIYLDPHGKIFALNCESWRRPPFKHPRLQVNEERIKNKGYDSFFTFTDYRNGIVDAVGIKNWHSYDQLKNLTIPFNFNEIDFQDPFFVRFSDYKCGVIKSILFLEDTTVMINEKKRFFRGFQWSRVQ